MNRRNLRHELIYNIRYAIQKKFIRDTGMDVECWVTDDLTAVVGRLREPDGVYSFTIPVVTTFEPHSMSARSPMAPMEPLGSRDTDPEV